MTKFFLFNLILWQLGIVGKTKDLTSEDQHLSIDVTDVIVRDLLHDFRETFYLLWIIIYKNWYKDNWHPTHPNPHHCIWELSELIYTSY